MDQARPDLTERALRRIGRRFRIRRFANRIAWAPVAAFWFLYLYGADHDTGLWHHVPARADVARAWLLLAVSQAPELRRNLDVPFWMRHAGRASRVGGYLTASEGENGRIVWTGYEDRHHVRIEFDVATSRVRAVDSGRFRIIHMDRADGARVTVAVPAGEVLLDGPFGSTR